MSDRRTIFNRFTKTPNAKTPISKIGPVSTDRNVAQVPQPSSDTATVDGKTLIQTYFTRVPGVGDETPIIYNGDRLWAKITLTLETAGPVVVGTQSGLAPVLSGKGQLLATGDPATFHIMKGVRLYILSTGVNRVKFVTEPIPWLEMITGLVGQLVGRLVPGSSRDPKPDAPATTNKSKL